MGNLWACPYLFTPRKIMSTLHTRVEGQIFQFQKSSKKWHTILTLCTGVGFGQSLNILVHSIPPKFPFLSWISIGSKIWRYLKSKIHSYSMRVNKYGFEPWLAKTESLLGSVRKQGPLFKEVFRWFQSSMRWKNLSSAILAISHQILAFYMMLIKVNGELTQLGIQLRLYSNACSEYQWELFFFI